MTINAIALATKGKWCGTGPNDIALATKGYWCVTVAFTQAVSGILTMTGALATVFLPASGPSSGQKRGGIAINLDIGLD